MANRQAVEVLLTVVIVNFASDGSYSAVAHHGTWETTGEFEQLRQVRIFKRGAHRVKLAVYGASITNIDEWGAWLCGSLIDHDDNVWKHVDLSACDR